MAIDYSLEEVGTDGLEELALDDSFLEDIDYDSIYSDLEMPEYDFGDVDSSFWGDLWKTIGGGAKAVGSFLGSDTTKDLLNFGSGIYGMFEADKLRRLSEEAFKRGDPFGDYRKDYAEQLKGLMADPSSITKRPGYEFQFNQGAEALSRKMGSQGYLGSGNLGTALVQYGQDYASSSLDKEIDRLSMLAGANISPNQAAGLSGYGSGIDVASQSLASLGYGSVYADRDVKTPRPVKGPSAAGGEAAKLGGLVKAGTSLAQLAGVDKGALAPAGIVGDALTGNYGGALKKSGNYMESPALSTAGDLVNIYTGIEEGGVGGYAKAYGGVSSLAGYNAPAGLKYIDAIEKFSEGDVGGGGYSAMTAAAGPIAMIGSFAADMFNKSGDKKIAGTSNMIDALVSQGILSWDLQGQKIGRTVGLRDTRTGKIVFADDRARTASEALRHGDAKLFETELQNWFDSGWDPAKQKLGDYRRGG